MEAHGESAESKRRDRQRFMIATYLIFVVMVLISVVQWLVLLLINDCREFYQENSLMGMILFLLAAILITIFIFFQFLRFLKCVNLVFAVVIMEFICLGVMSVMVYLSLSNFLYSFCVTSLIVFIVLIIASVCKIDLTFAVVYLYVIAFVLLISGVYFLMMYILTNYKIGYYMFIGFYSAAALIYMMYHAQAIMGGHYTEIVVMDYYIAALILYALFVLLMVLTFDVEREIESEE